MDRRRFVVAVAGVGLAGLAGCAGGGGAATPEPEYDVGMRSSLFRPTEIEVSAGDTVVWRNTNSRAHTVTAYGASIPDDADYFASGGYDSERAARQGYLNGLGGAIYTSEEFAHAFEVPGEYRYFCVPHERAGMVGTVVVRG